MDRKRRTFGTIAAIGTLVYSLALLGMGNEPWEACYAGANQFKAWCCVCDPPGTCEDDPEVGVLECSTIVCSQVECEVTG